MVQRCREGGGSRGVVLVGWVPRCRKGDGSRGVGRGMGHAV